MKREILINANPRETRVAILEDDQLVELLVDRPEARRMVGDIYLGRVEAVLPGIQAAVSVGLGVSVLPEVAILPDHQIIDKAHGFLPITNTEVGLVVADGASPACREMADVLAQFYRDGDPRKAA